MSRILLCADGFFRNFSPLALEPYIQQFVDYLTENGNTVMPYILEDIKHKKPIKVATRKLRAIYEAKKFAPEIIFSFNNVIEEFFLKNFECPIYIVASDTPAYWHNLDLLKKYNKKYFVLYFNDDFKDLLKDKYGIGYDRQQLLPYSTSIKTQEIEQDKNISFIGNFFSIQKGTIVNLFETLKIYQIPCAKALFSDYKDMIQNYLKTGNLDEEMYQVFYNNVSQLFDSIYYINSKLSTDDMSKTKLISKLMINITNNMRIKLLEKVCDLGLHIYTFVDNMKCCYFSPELFLNIEPENVYSTEQNEYIYNSSKISLNLPHAQVKTGFSWRVCDILASNSLLISNGTRDLKELCNGIIPTFKDADDLRNKCKYYLENETERKQIVKECNKIIDEKFRFENAFNVISDFSGINFKSKDTGSIKNLSFVQRKQDKYIRKNAKKD